MPLNAILSLGGFTLNELAHSVRVSRIPNEGSERNGDEEYHEEHRYSR